MNLPASLSLGRMLCIALVLSAQSKYLHGAFVTVSNPNTATDLSVQISLNGTDFQGAIANASGSSDFVLNPRASTAFRPSGPLAFQIAFNSGSGSISLMVDFNRDGNFSGSETLTVSSKEMPKMNDFGGKTFEYLSVSAFDSNSSRKSILTDLRINDDSFGAVNSGGRSNNEIFFHNTTSVSDIVLSGNLILNSTFSDRGRTTWKVDFRSPTSPRTMSVIPEPMGFSLFVVGGIAMSLIVQRRFRTDTGK